MVRRGKGGVHRRVPLTAPVRRALHAYLEAYRSLKNDDPLWVGQRGSLADRTGIVKPASFHPVRLQKTSMNDKR